MQASLIRAFAARMRKERGAEAFDAALAAAAADGETDGDVNGHEGAGGRAVYLHHQPITRL